MILYKWVMNMVKIAVVDDCRESLDKCKKIISLTDTINVTEMDSFDSGSSFLEAIDRHYNIVILDIDMPNINGFDVAREIRRLSFDTIIMFYTAHEQYVFKSFEFQPFRYIRKDMAENELPFALECAMMQMKHLEKKTIYLKTPKSDVKLDIDNIVYFEKFKHNIEIMTVSDEVFNIRKTLSELFDMINDERFIYAHKSAVVNLKYINKITPTDVILENNRKIPISRRNYKTIKLAFSKYVGGLL